MVLVQPELCWTPRFMGPTPDTSRELAAMVVPQVGRLVATG